MNEKKMKLIIFCKSKEKSKASKGKTWSRGTNSRLPFKGHVILNLPVLCRTLKI